jgi:hypothetical protein
VLGPTSLDGRTPSEILLQSVTRLFRERQFVGRESQNHGTSKAGEPGGCTSTVGMGPGLLTLDVVPGESAIDFLMLQLRATGIKLLTKRSLCVDHRNRIDRRALSLSVLVPRSDWQRIRRWNRVTQWA